ncbi:hypothetical protein R5R35_006078 [Gryllus longicercus]|uniref:TPX2 C-terminal domain-containing protein n=2 Tax=Gryllus longicercus TaxID=2509291 RepID=A0AAN9VW36_9ORTH
MLEEITSDVQSTVESKKRKRDEANTENKFISIAEQTKSFEGQLRHYSRTPTSKYYPTIPESPVLLTEKRVRSMKYQSTEDGLQKEMSKLKLMPGNSKIHGPLEKPFELTVYKRKVVQDSSLPFRFDAKSSTTEELHNQCDTTDKPFISLAAEPRNSESYETHLQSRIQTSKDTGDNQIVLGKSPNANININKTQPNPFSFEKRDKLMMKNKNEKMKKILQEEQKARIFHAKSVPAWVKLHAKDSCNRKKSQSATTNSNDDEKKTTFKPDAATVQKKTVVPKLPTLPENILHTELRAQSRKEFDKLLKQKEREIEIELQRRKEKAEKEQEEEVALLRRQTVHKPQPIGKSKSQPEGSKHAVIS